MYLQQAILEQLNAAPLRNTSVYRHNETITTALKQTPAVLQNLVGSSSIQPALQLWSRAENSSQQEIVIKCAETDNPFYALSIGLCKRGLSYASAAALLLCIILGCLILVCTCCMGCCDCIAHCGSEDDVAGSAGTAPSANRAASDRRKLPRVEARPLGSRVGSADANGDIPLEPVRARRDAASAQPVAPPAAHLGCDQRMGISGGVGGASSPEMDAPGFGLTGNESSPPAYFAAAAPSYQVATAGTSRENELNSRAL